MKHTFIWCILTCLLTAILSIFTYKSFYAQNSTEDINEILECNMEDDVCALKASERTRFINDITAQSYAIEQSTGGAVATVNFPMFGDQSSTSKEEIIRKIQGANPKTLILGFASQYDDYSEDIKRYISKIPFQTLHMKIYSESPDIIGLLGDISWKENKDMNIILEFVNVDLPKKINIFNYTYAIREMIERNNHSNSITSFQLIFNPLFYKFESIDNIITRPLDGKILRNLPTRNLRIIGIPNIYTSMTHDEQEFRKGRITDFFQQSAIPFIEISDIAKLENGRISFIGF